MYEEIGGEKISSKKKQALSLVCIKQLPPEATVSFREREWRIFIIINRPILSWRRARTIWKPTRERHPFDPSARVCQSDNLSLFLFRPVQFCLLSFLFFSFFSPIPFRCVDPLFYGTVHRVVGSFHVGKNIRNNIITGSQHTLMEETFASAIRNQLGP